MTDGFHAPAMAAIALTSRPNPRLLPLVRSNLRLRHFSPRTEEVYMGWVRRFVRIHRLQHPAELGEAEVRVFLLHPADERQLGPSSLNQAVAARLFRYGEVLRRPLGSFGPLPRALGRKYPMAGRRLPWQWVFPATRCYRDVSTGQLRRHHLHESAIQRAMAVAVRGPEVRQLSHVAALVRDASPRERFGHPDGAGAAGPPRCIDDDDLYPRLESWRAGGDESGRSRWPRRPPRRIGGLGRWQVT